VFPCRDERFHSSQHTTALKGRYKEPISFWELENEIAEVGHKLFEFVGIMEPTVPTLRKASWGFDDHKQASLL